MYGVCTLAGFAGTFTSDSGRQHCVQSMNAGAEVKLTISLCVAVRMARRGS